MTRLQADLAIGFAGLIWGFGFVAQKTAFDHIGPFTFVAARFLLSALIVLPLAFYERGFTKLKSAFREKRGVKRIIVLCSSFSVGVLVQQYGINATTVTNAAFLTGLYIVMVPFVGYFFHCYKLSLPILLGAMLSVIGIWLLSGGRVANFKINFAQGDGLIILCAFCFAIQVATMGRIAGRLKAPFSLSFLQYLVVGITALVLAACFEKIEIKTLMEAWLPIVYAGIASGGLAYTLQAVAQQHTPSADAAILMSSESLFGGVGGVWLLKEKIATEGIWGCGAIIVAILLVELGPLWKWGRNVKYKKP